MSSLRVGRRKYALALAMVLALAALAVYLDSSRSRQALPPGCVKPAGGYLIIATNQGYNDSIGHGAPQTAWPVIHVSQGDTVKITVCNTDVQAHGFQVGHYYDSSIESLLPGQVVTLSFVADQKGTYQIYCSVPCTVHIYMQSGELMVG